MHLARCDHGWVAMDGKNHQATFARTPIATLTDGPPPSLSPILLSIEYALNFVHDGLFAKSGNDVI